MSEVDPTQHLHKSHDRLQVKIYVMTILTVVFFLNDKHYSYYTPPCPPSPHPHTARAKEKKIKHYQRPCSLFPFQICYTKCSFKILIKKKAIKMEFYMKSNT